MTRFHRPGRWLGRLWRGPWLELALTALLFFTLGPQTYDLGPSSITAPVLLLLSGGALANAFRARWAPGLLIIAIVVLALSVPFYSFLSFALCMLSVFTLSSRGHTKLAGYAAGAYVGAGFVTTLLAMPKDAWAMAPVVLVCTMLVPFPLGMGLRAARLEGAELLERTLRRQRREIANELHDYVTHDLSLLVMRAEQSTLTEGEDPHLAFIAATARRCNANARHLMGLLLSSEPEQSSVAQLADTLSDIERRLRAHHFSVTVMASDDPASLPRQAQVTLAKVAREVATNVVHHGDPSQPVTLLFSIANDWASFTVLNTPLPHSRSGLGHGVPIMQQRIESFSGTFFSDRHGDQWITRVGLPLGSSGRLSIVPQESQ